MMTETTFSHDSDLEEAVIGACMIERAAMPLVADKLRPEMFYEEKNLEIFAALQSMYRSAKSIDTITLKNELAARGKLDAVGGPYELLRISSKVSSSAHLEYHALILRQLHTRRIMRTGFQQLLAFSADESMDIDDILVEAHRLLEGLEDESGAIEQDADMVMLLCRPALYGKTVDKKSTYPTDGLGIVIIAKHRNGKTGEVYFHHNQSMTKLVDYIPPLEWLTRNAK